MAKFGMEKLKNSSWLREKALPAVERLLYAFFAPVVAGAKMAWTGIKLIWGREEQAAMGFHGIAMVIIAGAIMAVAKPIAFWLTGWTNMKYDKSTNTWYADRNNNNTRESDEPAVPAELYDMVGKVFDLVFYIGVILLVIGAIIAGIRLEWRKRKA